MFKVLKSISISAAFLALVSAAMAGMPEALRQKCPIGGPRIKYVATSSCTTFGGGLFMNMRLTTSCDFVTRLPTCEKADFPAYRKFSPEESKKPKREIIKSEGYNAALGKSRYYRAYLIEQEFKTFSPKQMYWLLQQGYLYDPDNTYGDADYLTAYRAAANAYLKQPDNAEKYYILLAGAYAMSQSGMSQDARRVFGSAQKHRNREYDLLVEYERVLSRCLISPKSDTCRPNFYVEFD